MPKSSKRNCLELPNMLKTFRKKSGLNAITFLRMSNSGPNTRLESRSSLPGLTRPNLLLLKDFPNQQIFQKPKPWVIRFMVLRRLVLIT